MVRTTYSCRCGSRRNTAGTLRSEGKLYCSVCGDKMTVRKVRTDHS